MACSIINPLDCVQTAAKSAAGDAFTGIAEDFAKAADSTVNWLWGQLGQATAVHLGGVGFNEDLGIVAAISGVVALGLFLIQIATSVLRRDSSGLGRAVKGLFVAFLAGGIAVGVTNLALSVTDTLSAGIVQLTMGTTIEQMGPRLISAHAVAAVSNPAGSFLLAIVAIMASVVVWAALLVRKALIVVSAIFAPLAFAGSLADVTVSWTKKWIEMMVALVASKLVLVLIFVVGWGILDGHAGQTTTSTPQTVTQTATGLLILTLAGFAPWMALKLVHFSEDQFHRLHVLSSGAASGARTAAAAPQKVAALQAAGAGLGLSAAARGAGSGLAVNGAGQPSPTGPATGQPSPTGGAPGSPPGPPGAPGASGGGPSQSPPAPGAPPGPGSAGPGAGPGSGPSPGQPTPDPLPRPSPWPTPAPAPAQAATPERPLANPGGTG